MTVEEIVAVATFVPSLTVPPVYNVYVVVVTKSSELATMLCIVFYEIEC